MKLISVIGIGMGNPDNITVEAAKAIDAADVVIGAEKLLHTLELPEDKRVFYEFRPDKIKEFIDNNNYTNTAVVFNGDISLFSGGTRLLDILDEKLYDVRVYPGISSVSYLAAKLGVNWGTGEIINVRGKDDGVVAAVRRSRYVFALTNDNTSDICSRLLAAGLGDVTVCIGERLSHKNERLTAGYAREFIDCDFDKQSIVFIENRYADGSIPCGINNEAFVQGSFNMLGREVRAAVLSYLAIKPDDICFDIGAGNGSMAVEMSLAAYRGRVYAVERNTLGTQLIIDNCEKFNTENITIAKGKAPDVLLDLPKPDVVFVEGNGGFLNAIVNTVLEKGDNIRLAAVVYSLEDLNKAVQLFNNDALQNVEIKQLCVTKFEEKHGATLPVPSQPVFVICGIKAEVY